MENTQEIYIRSVHPTYNIPYWYCPATSQSTWTLPTSTDPQRCIIIVDADTLESTMPTNPKKNGGDDELIRTTNTTVIEANNQWTIDTAAESVAGSSIPSLPLSTSTANDTATTTGVVPSSVAVTSSSSSSLIIQSPFPTLSSSNNDNSNDNHSVHPSPPPQSSPTHPLKPSVSSSPVALQHNSVTTGWTLLPSSTLKSSSNLSTEGNNTPLLPNDNTIPTSSHSNDTNSTNSIENLKQRYGWNDSLAHTALMPDNDPNVVSASPLEGVAAALVTASNGNDRALNTVKKVLSRLAYHPEIGTPERTSTFLMNNNSTNNNTPQPNLNDSPVSPDDTTHSTKNDSNNSSNNNGRLSAVAVYEMMEQFLSPIETEDIALLTQSITTKTKGNPNTIINNDPITTMGNSTNTSTDPFVTNGPSSSIISPDVSSYHPPPPPSFPVFPSSHLSTPSKRRSPSTLMLDPQLPPDSVRAFNALLNPSTDGFSFLKKGNNVNSRSGGSSNRNTPSSISLGIRTSSPIVPPLPHPSHVTQPIPVRNLPPSVGNDKDYHHDKGSSSPSVPTVLPSSSSSVTGSIVTATGSIVISPRSNKKNNDDNRSRASSIVTTTSTTNTHPVTSTFTSTTTALQNTFRPIAYETNPVMNIRKEERTEFMTAIQQEIIEERQYQDYQLQKLLQQQQTTVPVPLSSSSSSSAVATATTSIGLAFQEHPSDHTKSIRSSLLPFDPTTPSAVPVSLALLQKHTSEPLPLLEHTLSVIPRPMNNDFPLYSIAPSLSSLMNTSTVPSVGPVITVHSPSRSPSSSSSLFPTISTVSSPLSSSSSSSSIASPYSNRFHLQSGSNTQSAFSPPRSPVNGQSMNTAHHSLSPNNSASYSRPRSSSTYGTAVYCPAPASPVSVLSDSFPLTSVPEESITKEGKIGKDTSNSTSTVQPAIKSGTFSSGGSSASPVPSTSTLSSLPWIPPPQAPPILNHKLLALSQALSSTNEGSIENSNDKVSATTNNNTNITAVVSVPSSSSSSSDSMHHHRPLTPPFPPVSIGTTLMEITTDKLRQGILNFSSSSSSSDSIEPDKDNTVILPSVDNDTPVQPSTATTAVLSSNIDVYLPVLPTTISPVDEHLLLPSVVETKKNKDTKDTPSFIITSSTSSPSSAKKSPNSRSPSKNELLMHVLDAIIDVQQATHTKPISPSTLVSRSTPSLLLYPSLTNTTIRTNDIRIDPTNDIPTDPPSSSSSSFRTIPHHGPTIINVPSSNTAPVTTLYTKQMPKVPVMTQLLARIALG